MDPPGGQKGQERQQRRQTLLKLLRDIRREAGLRQVELAKRLGKPQSFVSKYESGERRLDLLDVEEVCQAVGVSVVTFTQRFQQAIAGKREA